MNETRESLLIRVRIGDEHAWEAFADLYRPLVHNWLRRHGLGHHDVEDLTQDVMLAVHRGLPGFEHNGRPGAFRCWLRVITVNRTRDFCHHRGCAPGGGSGLLLEKIRELEDPNSDLSRLWDEEHDQYILRRLLDLMALEFEPVTLQAFRRMVIEGVAAPEAAHELGLSVGAVYIAKWRVLKRLRQEADGFLDTTDRS